jgi:hypothetical protein
VDLKNADHFFETARERYRIRQRREVLGQPAPWTDDKIFRSWRFCNVHREHDKTTTWFRENVRQPLEDAGASNVEIVFATMAFRWFNRIETGEKILSSLVGGWHEDSVRTVLEGVKPITTGAYMIKTPTGLDKLEGVLWCISNGATYLPKIVPMWGKSLQLAGRDLLGIEFLGGFLAYELITDLRHTKVLNQANDIMTWTNAGPGCARGLGWVVAGRPDVFNRHNEKNQSEMLEIMYRLLMMSQDPNYWPQEWEPWDMREPEMWACEYDKYMRAKNGQPLKRRFGG